MHALERNFNGVDKDKFSNVCASFLAKFLQFQDAIKEAMIKYCRHPIQVLQNSLSDVQANASSRYDIPRFKMIIDESNDDSIMRLLEASDILSHSSHSFYKLSGLEEGAPIEQLNLVSRVKFAAQQGDKTAVLSQVDAVSECFYDLFNQHYKEVKKGEVVSLYSNIAVGGISRPSKIHPSFQCIVHVQSSQLDDVPAPYLNRFEKFQLSIADILSWQITRLPCGVGLILSNALRECEEFLSKFGNRSVWSSSTIDTLKSIFISMIPRNVDAKQNHEVDITYSGKPISTIALSFMKHWLAIDIKEEDIKRSISIALEELGGIDNIELRKVLEEGSPTETQLEQSFHDLAYSESIPEYPMLRSLESIVRLSIVRFSIIKLLQVALPEEVYMQR